MMKYDNFYILFLIAFLAVACSETHDEPVPEPTTPSSQEEMSGDVISFAAEMEERATTRAGAEGKTVVYGEAYPYIFGVEDLNALKSQGFGVYAYYTGGSDLILTNSINDKTIKQILMLNKPVTHDGENWTYSPKQYWPASEKKLSFFAYAPYTNTTPYPLIDPNYYTQDADGSWYFNTNNPEGTIKVPEVTWEHSSQKDWLWGISPTTNLPNTNVKHTAVTNNTVRFQFRHALARAKFSIFNYLNATKKVAETAVMIETPSGYIASGKESFDVSSLDVGDDPNDFGPSGTYIFLTPNDPVTGQNCHRLSIIGNSIVVVTKVELRNVYKNGTLSLNNTDPLVPKWTINDTYASYEPAPLNESFYLPDDVETSFFTTYTKNYPTAEDVIAVQSLVRPSAHAETTPLTYAVGAKDLTVADDTDDDFEHYILFLPQKNDNTVLEENRIELVLSYKVITAYRLDGNYQWVNGKPQKSGVQPATPVRVGFLGLKGTPYTLSTTLSTNLESHKSYHFIIGLGDKMTIRFEVEDWDNVHEITLPGFD